MANRRIIDQSEATSLSGDDYLIADNSNLGTRKIQFTRLLSGATPLPPNYLTGFEINKYSTVSFSVSSGYARSSDNLRNIQLSTNLIKDISATFDLGNNAGCMPSGLTLQASTKYYIFAISTSSGQTDIIVDTDENCSNGLVDNIVILNNFDKFIKIGYLTTDSSSLIKFIIYDTLSSDKVDYIIDQQLPTAENNYTWYDLYKSGKIVQGGTYPNSPNQGRTITLPVAMSDTNYFLTTQPINTIENNYFVFNTHIISKTQFYCQYSAERTVPTSFKWKVEGKADLT